MHSISRLSPWKLTTLYCENDLHIVTLQVEGNMLELYDNINSVCAQKVRIALKEKGQNFKDHLMTLRGDQFDPSYLKLYPNGVVPTLVHDGQPIVESSLILYYIDELFPEPPLMPGDARGRYRVRMHNKLIDEYLHNSCTILTLPPLSAQLFSK